MTIVHYIPSLDKSSGGTTVYMQLLAKELGKQVDLHVVSHRSENIVTIENAKIHFLPSFFKRFYRIKKDWQQLLQIIQPDVIHVNCCWRPLCAFIQKWSQQADYKVVLTLHGMLEPWIIKRHYWTRKLPALFLYQKDAIKNADCIHTTAESEKQNLLNLGYNHRITVIPNGIDIDSAILKSEWKKSRIILYLSRVHIQKGIELLIDAADKIESLLAGYKIIIAGEGESEYIKSLKKKIRRKGLVSLFDFVGGVYGDKKWELFRRADIFILPTYSENFGIVVAEALASGTPVITTKGTPWQQLEIHRCGWWIDNDVNTIAQTLTEAIVLSEEEYRQMGERGQKLIENNYSVEIVAEKMKRLYQWILEGGEKPEFVYE